MEAAFIDAVKAVPSQLAIGRDITVVVDETLSSGKAAKMGPPVRGRIRTVSVAPEALMSSLLGRDALRFILAHELGHLDDQKEGTWTDFLALIPVFLGLAVLATAGISGAEDSVMAATLAGVVVLAAISVELFLVLLGRRSRRNEFAADSVAVNAFPDLVETAFDSMIRFRDRDGVLSAPGRIARSFATHPPLEKRKDKALLQAEEVLRRRRIS